MMKYPHMREELIGHLQALSDIHYQRDVWVNHQQYPGIEHDELDYAIHFIFDDTCLAESPSEAIGWFLKNEKEAEAIKNLVIALETILNVYGAELDDSAYIIKPEWSNVLRAAADAKALIV